MAASFLCASTAITGLKDCEISCCFVFRSDLAITFYPTLTWSLQFLLICVIIKNNICPVYIWDQRMYYFSLWSPGPLFFIVFTVSFCIKSSFFLKVLLPFLVFFACLSLNSVIIPLLSLVSSHLICHYSKVPQFKSKGRIRWMSRFFCNLLNSAIVQNILWIFSQ